jgi:hypothetical protein
MLMPSRRFSFKGKREMPSIVREVAPGPQPAQPSLAPTAADILLDRTFFISLADELWRLKGRIDRFASDGGSDHTLKLFRDSHRRLAEPLEGIGLSTVDYSGQPYVDGTRLDIAYMEDGTDPDKPLVIKETLRPGILWQGSLIRSAQVVLGQERRETSEHADD